LREVLAVCQGGGHAMVFLWTERSLEVTTSLFRVAGFRMMEEKPVRLRGADVVEKKYELVLG
jgi:hypothetical protein